MEIRNHKIRIDSEELADPRWIFLKERFVRNADDQTDTHLYFTSNPMDREPWRVFHGVPVIKPAGPPAEFLRIFGQRPIGDLGRINDWELVLGAWLGSLYPLAESGQLAQAQLNFAAYGMGKPAWFALRRANLDQKGDTAYKVAFPEAAHTEIFKSGWPPMYYTDARFAIEWPQFAVAQYQSLLLQAGIEVENLVPVLNPQGRIDPAGH